MLATGLARLLGTQPTAEQLLGSLNDVSTMPPGLHAVVRDSYGLATAYIFWLMTATALISFVCVLNMREVLLRTTIEESTDSGDVDQRSIV